MVVLCSMTAYDPPGKAFISQVCDYRGLGELSGSLQVTAHPCGFCEHVQWSPTFTITEVAPKYPDFWCLLKKKKNQSFGNPRPTFHSQHKRSGELLSLMGGQGTPAESTLSPCCAPDLLHMHTACSIRPGTELPHTGPLQQAGQERALTEKERPSE